MQLMVRTPATTTEPIRTERVTKSPYASPWPTPYYPALSPL